MIDEVEGGAQPVIVEDTAGGLSMIVEVEGRAGAQGAAGAQVEAGA